MQTDILINLVSALAGGLILKIWDSFFATKKEAKDADISLIEKLQLQIDSVNKRQDELQSQLKEMAIELDTWKEKYYDLLKKYNKLLARYLPNHEDN